MDALKILAALAVIGAFSYGALAFERYCDRRFRHSFFTRRAFFSSAAVAALLVGGYLWRQSAILHHGDRLNGVVVMATGVIAACVLGCPQETDFFVR